MRFKVVAVDDDPKCLSSTLALLKKSECVSEAIGFQSATEALAYIKLNYVPVLILDIRMPGMDGLSLAAKALAINPKVNIIFLTTYSHYLPQAFSLHASGYVLKPLDEGKLENEFRNLRSPIDEDKMGFYAQTFGSFKFFYNGDQHIFKNDFETEIMAYLVNANGKRVTAEKVASDLEKDIESVESTIQSIIDQFFDLGEDGVLFKTKKGYFLDMSLISSDVQNALKGVMEAKYLFTGEYLSQYKWAHERQKELISIL